MKIDNGKCLHIIHFGTFKEEKYFLSIYRGKYDLIGLMANYVAYAPDSMAAFISRLSNKSYFIDPQFYAFQQDPITVKTKNKEKIWVLKKSVEKLANEYGSVIKENVGKNKIAVGLDNDIIKEICKKVLTFQFGVIQKASKRIEECEFLDYISVDLTPEFLIAPYFYIESDKLDKELSDNIKFISESRQIINSGEFNSSLPLFAEIVLDKEVLFDPDQIKKVIESYKECNVDGYLIWIDNFLEITESESALKKYKEFLSSLCLQNKPIINLHGSYFSIALSSKELKYLAGVAHGIEYGEHRPVIPVGGGVPRAKFYFPKFHKRVDYDPDAESILLEMDWTKNKKLYFSNVCNCEMCQQTITDKVMTGFHIYGETKISPKNGQAYATSKAMDSSRKHYLNNKEMEYKFCSSASISDIIRRLTSSKNIAIKIKGYPITHLEKWINLLKKD